MKATIDGNELTIKIDLREEGSPSSTGNTVSFGYEQAKNIVNWQGKPLTIQVNAYHKPQKTETSAPVRGPLQTVHIEAAPGKQGSLCAIPAAMQPSTVPADTFARLPAGVGCVICKDRAAEMGAERA